MLTEYAREVLQDTLDAENETAKGYLAQIKVKEEQLTEIRKKLAATKNNIEQIQSALKD